MNKRGAVSLESLRRALPMDGLLYLAIFGSQVRGDERPDSDLDVLLVSRGGCWKGVHDAIVRAPGGVPSATVLPHTPDTLARVANLYGSVEYGVLRGIGSEEVYRTDGFVVDLSGDIDFGYGAGRWLEKAEQYISCCGPGDSRDTLRLAADCLLRASLLSAGLKFPWTRDLQELLDTLPPDARPPLDLDALDAGRPGRGELDMVGGAYRFVAAKLGVGQVVC